MNIAEILSIELNKFWKWAGINIIEYEKRGMSEGLEEFMYPGWDNLIDYTHDAILCLNNGEKSKELLNDILEVMGLDNENEDILDKCEEILTNQNLEYLIVTGISFTLSHTKWQIAEIIGRKNNNKWEKYLLLLTNDSNKYVQRRSIISLSKINIKLAEQICYRNLSSDDYMLRLVSLRILNEISSELLDEAITMLSNDSCELIVKEIHSIKRS